MATGGKDVSCLARKVEEAFESVIENIAILMKSIKDGTLPGVPTKYRKYDYWKTFEELTDQISNWCTKLAVMFSKPPSPNMEDAGPLLNGLEKVVVSMVTQFSILPLSEGRTLHKEVSLATIGLLENVVSFLKIIQKVGCRPEACERTRGAANVNETCDRMLKRVSRDNMAAVFRVMLSSLRLLQDGVEEIDEMAKENGRPVDVLEDEEDAYPETGWSDDEDKFLQPCFRLVRMIPNLVSSCSRDLIQNGNLATQADIDQMDKMAELVDHISSQLDDFASSCYTPVDKKYISDSVRGLADCMVQLIKFQSYFVEHKTENSHQKPNEQDSPLDREQEIIELLESIKL